MDNESLVTDTPSLPITPAPQPAAAEPNGSKKVSRLSRGVKTALNVLAIIASALLSVVLLVLLTVGVLLGTLSAQFSGEPVSNVIESTDFNKILSTMGVDDELSSLYNKAVNAISSEHTDYYDTLKEFLDSAEFKGFVSASLNRMVGAIGEAGISVDFSSDDVIMLASFLKGPIEQYFGYEVTESDMELVESALDVLGVGGKLLTIPFGEVLGIVAFLRFILADTLRQTIFFICAVLIVLILLLNRKRSLTGTLMCAVPLALTSLAWATFSFITTLILMVFNTYSEAFAVPLLAYTAPPRNYMAEVSLILLAEAIVIMLVPWVIRRLKALISKWSA